MTGQILIDRGKLRSADRFGGPGLSLTEGSSRRVIQIMIAGNHPHVDAGFCQTLQLLRQPLMAELFAVESQITAQQDSLRFLLQHFLNELIDEGFTLFRQLAVALLNQTLKAFALIMQLRR